MSLVEDEPDLARLFAYHLSRLGYSCRIATTAGCAFDLLEQELFALAVIDVVLPDLAGTAVIDRIRGGTRQPGLAIVVSTIVDQHRLSPVQADAWLPKPFPAAGLHQAIETALHHAASKHPRPPSPTAVADC